ncbi:hypothetical protein CBR_g54990 [Chara braunii]|uniref:Reverse transcriptase domain-containing protein n=1 Tax=Chara braunii TaxID=69332 RepID=A0A388K7K3_CHABU|nr:hypothetical protein CBR_g54990 [Chara braunii]|eukprot:GBG66011.1 hypothetical protein CBR_g54990 [Chara braunii]
MDIALIPETKLSEDKQGRLADWWIGPQLWSPARGSKGGLAVLIHQRLEMEGQLGNCADNAEGNELWRSLLQLGQSSALLCNGSGAGERPSVQAFKIPETPLLEGLKLRSGRKSRMKAFADDLLATSANTQISLEALRNCRSRYAELSEAAVNWSKSVYFLPKEFELHVEWGMWRVPDGMAECYLGVQVALEEMAERYLGVQVALEDYVRKPKMPSCKNEILALVVSPFSILWFMVRIRKLSKGLVEGVRSTARRFNWKPGSTKESGYIAKVSWDTLCTARRDGGLALLDPESQNLTLLSKWLVRVTTMDRQADWCFLEEEILCEQRGLSRASDVWVAVMIQAFLNKRIRSKFQRDILAAWQKCRPNLVAAPNTRAEVLSQHLFENPKLTNSTGGVPFAADRKPGSYGMKWIQRGICRVGDLWNSTLGRRKSPAEIKVKLVQLPMQEERIQDLIAAIPEDWSAMLGPECIPTRDTRFRQAGEEGVFLKLESWDEDTPGKAHFLEFRSKHEGLPEISQTGNVT